MGTWQLGPFDNDGAADFLAEAEEAPGRSVTSALRAVASAKASDEIDVDAGSATWAACDLVALAFGRPGTTAPPPDVAALAARIKPTEAMRERALAALDRVADVRRSELAQLWAEGAQAKAFRAELKKLRARLVDAASGPPPKARAPRPPPPPAPPWIAGQLLATALRPGCWVVAQMLESPYLAILGGTSKAQPTPAKVARTARTPEVLAVLWVAKDAIAGWTPLGVAAPLAAPRPLYSQEYPPSYQCTLYFPDGSVRDVPGRECVGVEYIVRWGAVDLDERLRATFLGGGYVPHLAYRLRSPDDPPPTSVAMGRRRGRAGRRRRRRSARRRWDPGELLIGSGSGSWGLAGCGELWKRSRRAMASATTAPWPVRVS
ncbi:MAG: DUF4259 domain-containing protein [Myxococcales bacterium]|nr:DUF4259 domain-containing protein [Myxococcales bacterium]